MTHTEDLLCLVNDFPAAFSDLEENRHLQPESVRASQTQHHDSITDAKTRQLLQLTHEFPIAFADPEKPNEVELETCLNADTSSQVIAASSSESNQRPASLDSRGSISIPAGYTYALRRRVQTLTWGQVDFHLLYGERGLEAIWTITGKSGTEVQSLCEAICRLINLLLSNRVPIPEIIREIRGIRGADSEGLGPNRILGLADLIGKVLQEAPTQSGSADSAEVSVASSSPSAETGHQTTDNHGANLSEETSLSQILSDAATVTSALCPECGAELQQVNGCKGGACIVCGHSSCS